jgi:hypothetical protein
VPLVHRYSVTVKMKSVACNDDWWLLCVDGPLHDEDKGDFLDELRSLAQTHQGTWLVGGDFNLICQEEDKNLGWINRRLMRQFHQFLKDAALIEVHLHRRLYTSSNERRHPMLERIVCAFISSEWEAMFPGHDMQALSSNCSDHAPLLLKTDHVFLVKKRFQFRCFWLKFPCFLQAVRAAWRCLL